MCTDVTKFRLLEEEWTELCQTHDCVRSAAGIIDRMDFTKDPCEDFYEFTCGNFVKTKIPAVDHGNRNVLQEIQDEMYIEMKAMLESSSSMNSVAATKAKTFYSSCMLDNQASEEDDEETYEVLLDLIDKSGGSWCALDLLLARNSSSCLDDTAFDFDKRLSESIMNQIPSFVNVYVASPENDTNAPYAFHVSRLLNNHAQPLPVTHHLGSLIQF